MLRLFVTIGALSALIGVALGAFGAHGLRDKVEPVMLETWRTAVHYHLVHALGLILVGIIGHLLPASAGLRWAGWMLLLGTVLFSGSLYLMVISGQRWLGAITPFGGVAFLAGWGLLAWAVYGLRQ